VNTAACWEHLAFVNRQVEAAKVQEELAASNFEVRAHISDCAIDI
jgi:hypothetical protein